MRCYPVQSLRAARRGAPWMAMRHMTTVLLLSLAVALAACSGGGDDDDDDDSAADGGVADADLEWQNCVDLAGYPSDPVNMPACCAAEDFPVEQGSAAGCNEPVRDPDGEYGCIAQMIVEEQVMCSFVLCAVDVDDVSECD